MNISTQSLIEIEPKASPIAFILTGIVMTIAFCVAFVESITVISVYNKTPRIQSTTNLWIISVIHCDFLIILTSFPLVIIASFAQEYILGELGCKLDGFIVTFLGTTSIYLLAGLSMHRYHIVVRKNMNRNGYTRRKSKIFIAFCFFFGVFCGITPLFGWGSFKLEGIGVSCAPNWRSQKLTDKTYIGFMYILVLFLPVCVMIYSYYRIVMPIWREKRNRSAWIQQRRVKRDIRVTISVALTIVSFLVSWMPYAVVSLLESFFNMDLYHISPMLVQFPCLMAKTACIWNPLVYVCHNSQFREAFIQRFGLLRKFKKDQRVRESEMLESGDSARCSRGQIKLPDNMKLNRQESNL